MTDEIISQQLAPVLVAAAAVVITAGVVHLRRTRHPLRTILTGPHAPEMTLKLSRHLARVLASGTLDEPTLTAHITVAKCGRLVRLDLAHVDECSAALATYALNGRVDGPAVSAMAANARAALAQIGALAKLRAEVEALRQARLDDAKREHMDALERLWSVLQPGRAREGGRISKDWTDIGFQGHDPATDLRGMGYLSLLNLLHVAEAHTAFAAAHVKLYMTPGMELVHFPLAITSINVTGWLLELLEGGELDVYLHRHGSTLSTLHELHYALFHRFAALWRREAPASVMEFGRVQKRFLDGIREVCAMDDLLRLSDG